MSTKRDTILFGRMGNKQQDLKHFQSYLPTEGIKYVVEPFGGTFAISRLFYKEDKYKKYVNDTDPVIYEIYKNPEKYNKLKMSLNDIAVKHLNSKGEVEFKPFMKEMEETIPASNMLEYWKREKICRGVMVKHVKNPDSSEQVSLMKKIKFSSDDYLKIINKFSKKEDAFIFLDPPYLFSDNGLYKSQSGEDTDMSDMVIHILNIMNDPKTKAKMMLIINDLKLIRMIYGDLVKGSYSKTYGFSSRKEQHLIIMNY